MNTSTLKILIAVFLILHGLIHYSLTYVPLPRPGEIKTPSGLPYLVQMWIQPG